MLFVNYYLQLYYWCHYYTEFRYDYIRIFYNIQYFI